VDNSPSSWAAKAESELSTLKDVAGARIELDQEGEVTSVHVVTHSHKQARLIVRDVVTLLKVRFRRDIDYKMVSIAYAAEAPSRPPTPSSRPMPGPSPVAAAVPDEPVESEPEDEDREDVEPGPVRDDRIRFSSVNLFVSGLRTQAQVELRWKGIARTGSASGWSTRAGAQRLIADAALAAIHEFLEDEVALSVHEVETVKLGRRRAIVVSLSLLAHRSEKILVGTCTVEQDPQQAVVLATLSALNRIFGGLRTKEPTVYVLRPTST
jgi:hypothetical protein